MQNAFVRRDVVTSGSPGHAWGVDMSFSSAVRTFYGTLAHTRDPGQPRRVEPEQDSLANHTDRKKDTESDDEDSGSLVEAMHLLTPEDLRPGDEESVDDELALHGTRNEQEQTDCGDQTSPGNLHGVPPGNECAKMTKGKQVWSLGNSNFEGPVG